MQAAQVAHAAAEFAVKHPDLARSWHETSNYIVVLACDNEDDLLDHADRLHADEHPYVLIYEPDISEHTALAIAPGEHWRHLSHLPLAGRTMEAA